MKSLLLQRVIKQWNCRDVFYALRNLTTPRQHTALSQLTLLLAQIYITSFFSVSRQSSRLIPLSLPFKNIIYCKPLAVSMYTRSGDSWFSCARLHLLLSPNQLQFWCRLFCALLWEERDVPCQLHLTTLSQLAPENPKPGDKIATWLTFVIFETPSSTRNCFP